MAKNKKPSDARSAGPSPPRSDAQDQTKGNLVPGAGVAACERGPDGKLLPKAKGPPLVDEVEADVDAMEHVWNRPTDRTFQHQSFRRMKEADPLRFWDRLQELKKEHPPANGAGAKPAEGRYDPTQDRELTIDDAKNIEWGLRLVGDALERGQKRPADCQGWEREPDPITPDTGYERVAELLAKETAEVEAFVATRQEFRQFRRHRERFAEWLAGQPQEVAP